MARRTVRDWAADIAFVLGAFAVWARVMSTFPEDYADVTPAWMLAIDPFLGIAACAALWWRRRFPALIAIVLLPVLVIAGTAFGASLIAVFSVAAHRDWRISGAITAAYLLVTAPYFYTEADQATGPLAAMVSGALLYVVPFAVGIAVRSRAELATSRERQRSMQLAEARRAERRRIASEMHDVLTHRISLVSMHAGALAYRIGSGDRTDDRADVHTGDRTDVPADEPNDERNGNPISEGELAQAVEVIRQNAHQALTELGEVLTVLRSGEDEELTQPGLRRIPHLVAEARAAGQPVDFDPGGILEREHQIRPQLAGTLYRVIQEGLTNARKHAPGAPVAVRLSGEPGDELVLEISNPVSAGSGPAELPGIGAGLTGLTERVRLDHGTLRHGHSDGVFRLTARLPWSP